MDSDSVFAGEREPWPLLRPLPELPAEMPVLKYNTLLIQYQKEYIKFIGVNADLLKKMYTTLDTSFQAREEKMLLLVLIESTKAKYLPTDITAEHKHKLRRSWKWRRVRLKMKYFWHYEAMKWVTVLERLAAVAILFSGWGILGMLLHESKVPLQPMPPAVDPGQTGQ